MGQRHLAVNRDEGGWVNQLLSRQTQTDSADEEWKITCLHALDVANLQTQPRHSSAVVCAILDPDTDV
jgi:hypothetical protein